MWAKLFERNKDTNEEFHGKGGAYTVDVVLDKEELDKVSSSGSRLKPKITDEGIVIKFKRKHTPPNKDGQPIEELGGPPSVVDKDKEPWDDTVSIGNGSKVKVAFTVYETKMGKGTRLDAVQVLDLVEYETEESDTPREKKLPF